MGTPGWAGGDPPSPWPPVQEAAIATCLRSPKIDRAQDDSGRMALQLDVAELPRRARLDAVAQAQELLFALVGLGPRRSLELIHRVGGDGAGDIGLVILHREHHDHPVEVV